MYSGGFQDIFTLGANSLSRCIHLCRGPWQDDSQILEAYITVMFYVLTWYTFIYVVHVVACFLLLVHVYICVACRGMLALLLDSLLCMCSRSLLLVIVAVI